MRHITMLFGVLIGLVLGMIVGILFTHALANGDDNHDLTVAMVVIPLSCLIGGGAAYFGSRSR